MSARGTYGMKPEQQQELCTIEQEECLVLGLLHFIGWDHHLKYDLLMSSNEEVQIREYGDLITTIHLSYGRKIFLEYGHSDFKQKPQFREVNIKCQMTLAATREVVFDTRRGTFLTLASFWDRMS